MSEHRMDKIFQQGLDGHKTPPPADLWDRLEEQLPEDEEDRKAIWFFYRIAAAILLIAALSYVGYQSWAPSSTSQIAVAVSTIENEEVQNMVSETQLSDTHVTTSSLAGLTGTVENEEVQNRLDNAGTVGNEEAQNKVNQRVLNHAQLLDDAFASATPILDTQEIPSTPEGILVEKVAPLPAAELMPFQNKVVVAAITEVPLIPIDELFPSLSPFLNSLEGENGFEKAIAFADQVRKADFTLADLRDAKSELQRRGGLSLAALRDAKNEFLTFNWND